MTLESIKSVEKQKMEKLLDDMQEGMMRMSERFEKAFTTEEKTECIKRLKQMEFNYKTMWNKYETMMHHSGNGSNNNNNSNKKEAKKILEEYPGLQYDVDDPEVKAEIGKSLSYDSGYAGYTKKETEELSKLLEL